MGAETTPEEGEYMYTEDVLQTLGITRPVLQRLIDNKHLVPVNAVEPGSVRQRPWRMLFDRAAVEAVRANPPPRKPRARKAPQPAPPA